MRVLGECSNGGGFRSSTLAHDVALNGILVEQRKRLCSFPSQVGLLFLVGANDPATARASSSDSNGNCNDSKKVAATKARTIAQVQNLCSAVPGAM